MIIEYRSYITRKYVREHPEKTFLFGDNLIGKGYGGQAREMRDEPNAIGIPTKKAPSMDDNSFFTDEEFEVYKIAIDRAFMKIPKGTVVIPYDGLGTGRAELKKRAPKTWRYLQMKLKELRDD